MSSTASVVLPARSREGEITRVPRPAYTVPAVTMDEVDIALDLIVNKYKVEDDVRPLAHHAESLREFVLGSRQTAYAIVEMGHAMAEVENQIGDRNWFTTVWQPAMISAHDEGEALSESIREGDSRRASHTERRLIMKAIGPMFVEGQICSEWLRDFITRSVIGAYYDEKSKLVWSCVGVRVALKILELLSSKEAIEGFKADLKQAHKEDLEFIKAKKEEKRRAQAAEEAKAGEETEPAAGEEAV